MFHPDTQFLIDHWTGLARQSNGARAGMPERADLRPDDLGARLRRVVMLEPGPDGAVVRLAGDWIESLQDRPLANGRFIDIWTPATADLAAGAVSQTIREGRPVILIAAIGARRTAVEVTLVPFRNRGASRVLGLFAPSSTLTFARDESRLLTARMTLGVGRPRRPILSLAAVDGRRVA